MKYLLFIIIAVLPLAVSAHPILVSVCEITHDSRSRQMEITLKLFWDDFEDVLEDRTGEAIRLGQENENPGTDKFITDYLSETLLLSINGEPVLPLYHGREIEDVAVWLYLSVPDIEEVRSVTVSYQAMLHWFKDQVNVVHVDCNDKLHSTYFFKGREEETFRY